MFSTVSTDLSTNGALKKRGIHILFHTDVEKSVENFEYSLYIAFRQGNLNIEENEVKGVLHMIKGVNKKVIEINRPDSIYFERAVLYLRPEVTDVPLYAAESETDNYFSDLSHLKQGHGRIRSVLLFLTGAVSSAGVCLLVMWLIG